MSTTGRNSYRCPAASTLEETPCRWIMRFSTVRASSEFGYEKVRLNGFVSKSFPAWTGQYGSRFSVDAILHSWQIRFRRFRLCFGVHPRLLTTRKKVGTGTEE